MPQDVVLSAVAVETAKKKLTEAEQEIISQLNKANISVDVIVPEEMSADDFKVTLSAVCKSWAKAGLQLQMLLPVLGKLMLVASNHHELWAERDDQPFEDFVTYIGEKFGVGRETCFAAQRLVKRWDEHLNLDEWRKIGRNNLELINKTIPRGDESKKTARTLVELAQTKSTKELAAYIEEKGLLERDESRGATITFTCSVTVYRMWQRFIKDPHVQAYCETEKPDLILKHAIEECDIEWTRRAKEAEEAGQK